MVCCGYFCLNVYIEGCKIYLFVSFLGCGVEGEFKVVVGLCEWWLVVCVCCWGIGVCIGVYECIDGLGSEVGIMGIVMDEGGGCGWVDFDWWMFGMVNVLFFVDWDGFVCVLWDVLLCGLWFGMCG